MKKSLLILTVLALILCFGSGVLADAAIYDYGNTRDCDYSVYVATVDGGVNLREAPTTDSVVLCLIPDFVQLQITMESTSGNGWGYTNYNGYYGWVALSQVSKYYPISDTSYDVSVTAADGVNLRKGPYTSYGLITNIPHATVLRVDGTYNGWGSVSYNGTNGWIALSEVGEVNVTEEHEPMPIEEAPAEDAVVTSLEKEETSPTLPLMTILLGMIILVVVIAAVLIIVIVAKKK